MGEAAELTTATAVPVSTRRRKTLTEQELECAYVADFDLGPGYPQLVVPEYVRRLYLDDAIEELSLRFAPQWSPDKQAQVDNDLEEGIRRFLRIDPSVTCPVRSTFSGSIALDRAFAALARVARERRSEKIHVVTTTPCIDIMRLFLEERRDVASHFVPSRCDNVFGALDLDAVIGKVRALVKRFPRAAIVLLLTSPENPTGSSWSEDDLGTLMQLCADTGTLLMMDHCFALAGVHDDQQFSRVWDFTVSGCDWVAIWDTGKTFGLNEDKLGFIISGSDAVKDAVDASLAVLQFGVSRRQKLFFAELLRRAFFYDQVAELRKVCRENLAFAVAKAPQMVGSLSPTAGSLLLLDVSRGGRSDDVVRQDLMNHGVGVVAGSVFFHGGWRPNAYIRLALAREPEYFALAFDRLLAALAQGQE